MDAKSRIEITVADASHGKKNVTILADDEPVFTDAIRLGSVDARERYAKAANALMPALMVHDIKRQLLNLSWKTDRNDEYHDKGKTGHQDPQALLQDMPSDVVDEAQARLASPDLIASIVDDIAWLGVAGENQTAATVYLVGVSRLLNKPLAAIVQGASSSGKSHLIERVSVLFPPEAKIEATQITQQALYHMEPGSLVHKFVVAGERSRRENDDTAEATRALREMLSSGRLSKIITVKGPNNRFVTERIEQDGPIAYVESTTLTKIFEEDRNRCLLLSTDEGPEQTRRIIRNLASSHAGQNREIDTKRVIQVHHAMQRLLATTPCNVIIPFADKLAKEFPDDRVEARRAFGQFLGMVKVSALLHYRQRETSSTGHIVATFEDYDIARHLMDGPMAQALGRRVGDAAIRLHKPLFGWFGPEEFDKNDVANRAGITSDRARGLLSELCNAGMVTLADAGVGRQPNKYRVNPQDESDASASVLPSAKLLMDAGTQQISRKTQTL